MSNIYYILYYIIKLVYSNTRSAIINTWYIIRYIIIVVVYMYTLCINIGTHSVM